MPERAETKMHCVKLHGQRLRHGHTALGLTKNSHDLRFGETALSHSNLLSSRYEKILRPHPLNLGDDYPLSNRFAHQSHGR